MALCVSTDAVAVASCAACGMSDERARAATILEIERRTRAATRARTDDGVRAV